MRAGRTAKQICKQYMINMVTERKVAVLYDKTVVSKLSSRICLETRKAVLWNRNRRNRNFLTSGTGTVINYGSGTGTRFNRFNIKYLITFIKNHISQ
jgi:hypothetical protein